jgi:hypothetical protein
MVEGVKVQAEEGTPQGGGPLLPLLCQHLLDDLVRELSARGHHRSGWPRQGWSQGAVADGAGTRSSRPWAARAGRNSACAVSPRTTRQSGTCGEPPDVDSHVRWCERRVRANRPSYSICGASSSDYSQCKSRERPSRLPPDRLVHLPGRTAARGLECTSGRVSEEQHSAVRLRRRLGGRLAA